MNGYSQPVAEGVIRADLAQRRREGRQVDDEPTVVATLALENVGRRRNRRMSIAWRARFAEISRTRGGISGLTPAQVAELAEEIDA